MSLFEEYERRTALNPRPLFAPQTPTQAPRPLTEQERLAQLKARYEALKYEQKIRKIQNPYYYKVKVTRTIGARKSKPINWNKAAKNLNEAYGSVSRIGSSGYKVAKSGYAFSKPIVKQAVASSKPVIRKAVVSAQARYKRSGGIGGLRNKIRVLTTGSVYSRSAKQPPK